MSKILVVEDELSNRTMISKWLQDVGFEVVAVANASEAINFLYDDVSVVLADIYAPKVGGVELLKLVKQKVPHVDVILLTEFSSVELAIQALQLGAIDYLIKPINLKELTVKIGRTIERQVLAKKVGELNVKLKDRNELTSNDLSMPAGSDVTNEILETGLSLRKLEREAIRRALKMHRSKRKDTAETLGISVRTLQRRIKEYELDENDTPN